MFLLPLFILFRCRHDFTEIIGYSWVAKIIYNFMPLNKNTMATVSQIYERISKANKADIFLFSANVNYKTVDDLILEVREIKSRNENCILILTTYGGDPDAGYRLVRYMKNKYKKFIVFILGLCKSTGTLVALGADEIVMGDFGELGPLDIQLAKDDELANTSGLSYAQSLISLNERIYTSFEENFLTLKRKNKYITTKTAAEISSKLAIGIIEPISSQLDPLKLGEVQRAIKIAENYGKRIFDDTATINKLIGDYPSHSFVIDFQEAKELFDGHKPIREANDDEILLEKALFKFVRQETARDFVFYIEPEKTKEDEEHPEPATTTSNEE